MLVDQIDNSFNREYAAWPLRYFVLQPRTGTLLYKAQPSNAMYHLEQLCAFLDHHLRT